MAHRRVGVAVDVGPEQVGVLHIVAGVGQSTDETQLTQLPLPSHTLPPALVATRD